MRWKPMNHWCDCKNQSHYVIVHTQPASWHCATSHDQAHAQHVSNTVTADSCNHLPTGSKIYSNLLDVPVHTFLDHWISNQADSLDSDPNGRMNRTRLGSQKSITSGDLFIQMKTQFDAMLAKMWWASGKVVVSEIPCICTVLPACLSHLPFTCPSMDRVWLVLTTETFIIHICLMWWWRDGHIILCVMQCTVSVIFVT